MLSENQLKCINLIVTSNKTQKQIAKEINITEKTICQWKKNNESKEKINTELQENFRALAIEAQQELKNF